MITSVEARTASGNLLTLPLQDVTEGITIQDIIGLDPVDATVVSSSFAQLDGEQYQSSRRNKRNIVMTLGYDPDYTSQTIRDLRARLYSFFMPKSSVNLKFVDDSGPDVEIDGTVETFVAPLFAKDPNAVISILNFDPDFYDPTTINVNGFTTAGTDEIEIDYDGTVETGFLFTLNADRVLSGFTLYNRTADGTQQLQFISDIENADVLQINTLQGNKFANNTRAGTVASVLYGVSPYSAWIELFPGQNFIRVLVDDAGTPYTISYTNKYGGL